MPLMTRPALSARKSDAAASNFRPDFHIDVPCYHLDPDRDARALATETGGWEESDPKAIYQWFKSRYEEGGNGRS